MTKTKKPATQATHKTPKGTEIPVPKRRDFLKNLKQVAKPSRSDGSKKK